MPLVPGALLGPYEVLAPLGAGGMGEVWRARDTRLNREVALKVLHASAGADRERFRREARVAAAVSHPNVCSLYDVGEHDGEPYLAMELLVGESLADRLTRGPLPAPEAAVAVLQILAALEALHARGLVHRDLKPSNVFLTPHGIKLLDFGLALSGECLPGDKLTRTGVLLGTPRYMAPEQWSGGPVGPATDLFACGALLFEMVAGRPAFEGRTVAEIFAAATSGRAPALAGGRAAETFDRIVRRALAADPGARWPSAAAMAAALREAPSSDTSGALEVRGVTRLAVLPFRLLRDDPEFDFLGPALAEAVSAALGSVGGLVLRSSRLAERFASRDDLPAVAAEADVDALLVGTLQRAGGRVRLTTQLVDGPSGRVLHAATAQASALDLFDLQDDLTRQVAEGLRVSLTPRERDLLGRDRPARPEAYELYLRALRSAAETNATASLLAARDLLKSCLDRDPSFAPAWARLARVHRLLAKYGHVDAQENQTLAREAFDRAFALNPDLPLAHNLYTYFQIEELASPNDAMLRLLGRLETAPDPDVLAGLVASCRFGGLLDASIAAHQRARRLDPSVLTSVAFTYWMAGDWDRALHEDQAPVPFVRNYALPMLGREEEAATDYGLWPGRMQAGLELAVAAASVAAIRGDRDACVAAARPLLDSGFRDAEGLYFMARNLARSGERPLALDTLERVVSSGFTNPDTMRRDSWLDGLRGDARFEAILARAEEGSSRAKRLFDDARGRTLLGLDVTRTLVLAPVDVRASSGERRPDPGTLAPA